MHAWRQAAPGEVTNDLIERHLMHGSNKFVYLCFMTCHVSYNACMATGYT